jgi:hypothetical protein
VLLPPAAPLPLLSPKPWPMPTALMERSLGREVLVALGDRGREELLLGLRLLNPAEEPAPAQSDAIILDAPHACNVREKKRIIKNKKNKQEGVGWKESL